jgi:hypothetical protein
MSILNTADPILNSNIDLPAFRLVLDWLLDFNASAIPAPSSIAEHFWSAQAQLSNDNWSSELYHTLQSIIAFPLWQFNPNNFGNTHLAAKEIVSDLPPEFYTKASITRPYTRIVIDRSMFLAFMVLEGTVLAFVWLVPLWLCLFPRRLPSVSSYPIVDFAFKATFSPSDHCGTSLEEMPGRLFSANDKETRVACKQLLVAVHKDQ